jgi:hypothetical protein
MKIHIRKKRKLQQAYDAVPAGTTMQQGNTDPAARRHIPHDLKAQPFELRNMQGMS